MGRRSSRPSRLLRSLGAYFADSWRWSRLRRLRAFAAAAVLQAAVLLLVALAAAALTSADRPELRATIRLLTGTSLGTVFAFAAIGLLASSRVKRDDAGGHGLLVAASYLYGLLFGFALYLLGPFSGFTWLLVATSSLTGLLAFGAWTGIRLLASLIGTLVAAAALGMAGLLPWAPVLDPPGGDAPTPLRFAATLVLHLFAAAAGLFQVGFLTSMLRIRERMFRSLSTVDPLTGIPNRRAAEERLEEEWRRSVRYGNPLAVALADVDHFKSVNDRFGHEVGDRVLRDVARTLDRTLRMEDFVARWGGEEFLLVLPNQDAAHARAALERVRERLADLDFHSDAGTRFGVTVSFGLATAPAPGVDSPARLVAAADAALYRAKEHGRDRIEISGEVYLTPGDDDCGAGAAAVRTPAPAAESPSSPSRRGRRSAKRRGRR